MLVSTHGAVRASRRRTRAALGAAALCATSATLLVAAGAAPAAITTGPIDPASGFPFSYADDVQGFAVQQCQDDSGFCLETPRPDPSRPISVPDNYTEDGEGFWWLAEAVVPNAGTGIARFVKESAFDNDVISQDHQVAFSRIRFRFQGLVTGATYRVTHPYGVDEIPADPDPGAPGTGRINFTEDVGCIAPPCGAFPALSNERVTSFLRWDPTVGPAAPDGYVGNPLVEHKVIGSPLGTNFVRLERLDAPGGLVVETVGESDDFVVQGKLAGDPPPPAPHLGLSTTSLTFPHRQAGTQSAPQTVTVRNHGTADMHVGTLALADGDTADFALASNTCDGATLAAGAACSVQVRFTPAHSGHLTATLRVPSDAPGNPHGVALTGDGDPAVVSGPGGGSSAGGGGPVTTIIQRVVPGLGPASRPTVAGLIARPLAVRNLSLARRISAARLRAEGLRVTMRLPGGTEVVRVAIHRARDGRRSGPALVRALRLPGASGPYVLRLRSRDVRRLRPGAYVLEVAPARDLDDRGAASRIGFSVTR